MMRTFTLLDEVALFYKENIELDCKKSIEICLATHNETGDLWMNSRRVELQVPPITHFYVQ